MRFRINRKGIGKEKLPKQLESPLILKRTNNPKNT